MPCSLVGSGPELHYATTSKGDRICDFSYAGYRGGGVALPDVPEKAKVTPMAGDCSDKIQAAIDAVSGMPLINGFRGAVVMAPGSYQCKKSLNIRTSGVILRGSGSDKDGTIIQLTDSPHTCVVVASGNMTELIKSGRAHKEKKGRDKISGFSPFTTEIIDDYVPSGATSLSVRETGTIKPGNIIRISRPATAEWIHFMGMDNLVSDGKPGLWLKEGKLLSQEREVSSVSDKKITWEMPLVDCIDSLMLGTNNATVQKVLPDKKLMNCGVERLRITADKPKGNWSDTQNIGVILGDCADTWVRDLSILNQLPSIITSEESCRITIDSCKAEHPASISTGAGAPTDYRLAGQQALMNKCSAKGVRSFFVSTADSQSMLNVVLNCVFSGNNSIQPHMRWSTGLLLDGCMLKDGEIILRNRGGHGSGHGWTMGWAVVWNCTAKGITIEQPPGAINWCVGSSGNYEAVGKNSQDWLVSKGRPVKPESLYLAQLRARLGAQAVQAIGY